MANEQNLKPIRDTERARELQEKSVQKRLENIKEKKLLKELLIEKTGAADLDEIISNAIKRAKTTDRGFEVYRDTIGEKPTDKVDMNTTISYEDKLKEIIDTDEY